MAGVFVLILSMMMYKLGEIKRGNEIGLKNRNKYMWCACESCGKERWVYLKKGNPVSRKCHVCASPIRDRKGWRHPQGYTLIELSTKDAFFYPMATKQGRVYAHRLVMANHLNRCLHPWEVVHHLNGIKDDNRIENLQLLPDKRWHLVDLKMKSYIKRLEDKIAKLQSKH